MEVVVRDRLVEQTLVLCFGRFDGLWKEQVRNAPFWLEWSVTGNIWEIIGGVSFECGDGSTVCPRIVGPLVESM